MLGLRNLESFNNELKDSKECKKKKNKTKQKQKQKHKENEENLFHV
jgi:hypothetical protein